MRPTAPLSRAIKRLALTTKQGPHNYYKGNRTGAMGQHTKYGGYIIDWKKVRTYVCPDLTDFNVRIPSITPGLISWRKRRWGKGWMEGVGGDDERELGASWGTMG